MLSDTLSDLVKLNHGEYNKYQLCSSKIDMTSISYIQISGLQAIFMACYENIPVKLHPYVLNGMSNRIDINPHRSSNAYGMHCTCMHTCNIFGLEQKAMKTL